MKIAITGDTHYGITENTELLSMAERLFSTNPDIILHLGDIGETRAGEGLITDCLEMLNVDAAVLGNHDIWAGGGYKHTSLELWEKILPELLKKSGCCYLEHEIFIKDNVAIVGSYLHYDYSAQDNCGKAVEYIENKYPNMPLEEYYAVCKNKINNDGIFLTGLLSDISFSKSIGDGFKNRLRWAEMNPTIDDIVIVTHVPCMPSQITRKPNDLDWSIGTPYFGNLSHVEFIKTLTKVKYIISGHSHVGNENIEIFDDGHEVKVINLDSDYNSPTFITLEI